MKGLSLLLILLSSHYAWAECNCIFTPLNVQKIIRYDLVFEGELLEKRQVEKDSKIWGNHAFTDRKIYKYTFEVKDLIKGKGISKNVEIYAPEGRPGCQSNFERGKTYFIFSNQHDGLFHTRYCNENKLKKETKRRYRKIIRQFKKADRQKKWKNEKKKLTAKGLITNNHAEGIWIFYNPDKSIESVGNHVNSKKDGEWRQYLNKKASTNLWKKLTDEQKTNIENPKNILSLILTYDKGKVVDSTKIL